MIEKSVFLSGLRLALQRTKAVAEQIEILRGEGHEPPLGQAGGEIVIVGAVAHDRIAGPAFQPVLADDDRPPLVRL